MAGAKPKGLLKLRVAMPQPMPECFAISTLLDDGTGSSVYLRCCYLSGFHGSNACRLGLHHQFVNLPVFGVWFAKEDGTAEIVTKAVVNRAKVKQDGDGWV